MTSSLGGSQIRSSGIRAGTLLLPDFQYQLLSPRSKTDFRMVYTQAGVKMWRYRNATEPYNPPQKELIKINDTNDDVLTHWQNDEINLYNNLVHGFGFSGTEGGMFIIEGDEDEDFTYGIFVTVLIELELSETDWILEHEFGTMYSVQHIDSLTNNE